MPRLPPRAHLVMASTMMTPVMAQVMSTEARAPRISMRWYPYECRCVGRQLTTHRANKDNEKPATETGPTVRRRAAGNKQPKEELGDPTVSGRHIRRHCLLAASLVSP